MSAARKGKGPSTRDKVVSSALAVGAMAGIAGSLGLPAGSLADGAQFATADVTLQSTP